MPSSTVVSWTGAEWATSETASARGIGRIGYGYPGGAKMSRPRAGSVDAHCPTPYTLWPATIATARHHLKHFFAETPRRRLTLYTITQIEHYLASLGEKGWTRNGIRSFAYRLRGFFKYGESQGWTKHLVITSMAGTHKIALWL